MPPNLVPAQSDDRRTWLRRSGFQLVEMTAGVFVLGVALFFVAQLAGTAIRENHARRDREVGRMELSNLMERLVAKEIAGQDLQEIDPPALSDLARSELLDPRVEIVMRSTSEESSFANSAKRVTLTLSWAGRLGTGETGRQRLTLTAWLPGNLDPPMSPKDAEDAS